MYYDKFFKRADLRSVEAYILNGSELFEAPDENCVSDRIKECENNIEAVISENVKSIENHDDILSVIFSQISTYEELAFEAGFLSGAKIILQAMDRLKKLY